MSMMKHRIRAVAIDILGLSLILAAIPIGWIPGPGGIPLVILGLSLLATNHEWAGRLMEQVKERSANASKSVSESSPRAKWVIDILSIVFIAAAVILFTQFTQSIAITSAVSFVISGVILLATNQNRYKRLWNTFRKKHKNK
jgi:hypothetical protein